ncbi:MAG: 50S ribosomal protein L32 [Treponema sp.]|nr:50S ribosomal protein L32 [Treponema sp.]
MAVPRSKTSKAVTKGRQTVNMKLKAPHLVECGNCGNLILQHHVCPKCGFYNGRQVITPEAK